MFGCVLGHLLNIRTVATVEISDIKEIESKNICDGLAWSYYFGYLKLVLPGLHDMINSATFPNFTINGSDVRDKVAAKKIFIVFPKSCYCYDSFSEVDNRIIFEMNLPVQRITRCGVQERVYKNSLYRIQIPGKEPEYAILEYATPLMNIYDMSRHEGAAFSEEDKNEQIEAFFNKLNSILHEDKDCRDKVHLLLISGVQTKLADFVWQAIHEPIPIDLYP